MDSFAKRYWRAYRAEQAYREAPRRGWVDPKGRKTADNQTIEVPRKEVEQLAADLCSALYSSWYRLYENLALKNYMDQIAKDGLDSVECGECHFRYLPGWMDGKCPYCAADLAAHDEVNKRLEEKV